MEASKKQIPEAVVRLGNPDRHLVTTKERLMPQYPIPPNTAQYSRPILLHSRINLPRTLKAQVWYFTWGQCWYCGSHLNPFDNLCIDHVRPLARGGSNEIENLVPCCTYCNQQKGTAMVEEWRVNFQHAAVLDEEPWIHPSGLFWFEREDGFFQRMREDEIRSYHRMQKWNRS